MRIFTSWTKPIGNIPILIYFYVRKLIIIVVSLTLKIYHNDRFTKAVHQLHALQEL